MKLLVVNGSPRKGGNTEKTLDFLVGALRLNLTDEGIAPEIEVVRIHEKDIRPCRGCRACFDLGEEACPLKDDLLCLHEEILSADCVILASPVYVNDVSGTVKNLIDRLAFVCHRPRYWSTPFYLLATTGGTPFKHTLRTLQTAAVSWGAPLIGSSGYVTGARSSAEEIEARHGKRLHKAAVRVLSYLTGRKSSAPSFLGLLVFAVQQTAWKKELDKSGYDSADGRYWAGGGLLDRGTTYFTEHGAGKIKTALARGIGKLISVFFS
jgi:multimeric flavodoxin WrbA